MKTPGPDSQALEPVTKVSDATMREFFGYRMKRAFNVVQADLARTLKPFELRMLTCTALVLIVENPGLRQAQLADAMDMERPNLVVLVDELERRGLIRRDRMPNDRRAYALVATAEGRELCARAVAAVKAHEAALLRGVSPDLRAAAEDALNKIERRRPPG
ncbi:MarR family winged helix-turn-helix transcriptional regulator [Tropicimonas isoalkanivorans]|uniref:DNA-binding transcriptional regulator, MarR family n=1 Tax=Tropicimonas isoalkanivorans TaxID=441112 RepID=A0A1I1PIF2_9RHOB|nr:MarR family transcriptional regulator [Tropicimonas isoalkanivorans]SFD09624.1 DNA-binding transcriptional regulator, MarR family [Tropicimonas isoalkanivorans]